MTHRHATIMASLVLLAVLVSMVLVVRRANAGPLMHTVAAGRNPVAVAVDAQIGRTFVVNNEDNSVRVLDVAR